MSAGNNVGDFSPDRTATDRRREFSLCSSTGPRNHAKLNFVGRGIVQSFVSIFFSPWNALNRLLAIQGFSCHSSCRSATEMHDSENTGLLEISGFDFLVVLEQTPYMRRRIQSDGKRLAQITASSSPLNRSDPACDPAEFGGPSSGPASRSPWRAAASR